MSSESSDGTPKIKVVLDTSVLVAGFLRHGLAYSIVEDAINLKRTELVTSYPILEELNRVLRKRSSDRDKAIEAFIQLLAKVAVVVTPQKVAAVKDDPSDNMVIGTALSGDAALIVSLDKHLLKLKRYKHIGIIHPRTLTWILPSH